MIAAATKADQYCHLHRSDSRNTMTYAHTTSRTLLPCDISSLPLPAPEDVDFVELFPLWLLTSRHDVTSQKTWSLIVFSVFRYEWNVTLCTLCSETANDGTLGAFVKSRSAPISIIISVRPSVCLPACIRRICLKTAYWRLLLNSVEKVQIWLKSDKKTGHRVSGSKDTFVWHRHAYVNSKTTRHFLPATTLSIYRVLQKGLYNFTTLKAYRNLYRAHTQRFELSKCRKTHRVLPRIVIRNCFDLFFRFLL
jgi:hypothetical protein